MKRLLTILLFLPLLFSWRSPAVAWAKHYEDNTAVFNGIRIGSFTDTVSAGPRAIRYSQYYMDADWRKPVLVRYWTNYTWSNSNGNIVINSAAYPAITSGDTLKIPIGNFGGLGYRMRSITNISNGIVGGAGIPIVVYWQPGAFINPTSSGYGSINIIDACNGVKEYGMVMQDNINLPIIIGTSGYSHHVWIDHFNFQGSNGIGLQYAAGTLPSYTHDSINCEYGWRFSHGRYDSLIGGHDGGVGFTMGRIAVDGVWKNVEFDHDTVGDYSSNSVASNFGQFFFCINVNFHDNFSYDLGIGPVYAGHASQFQFQECKFHAWNNHFGPHNFGNEFRINGLIDDPAVTSDTGVSAFNNNIIDHKVKYPVIDFRSDPADTALLHFRRRRNPDMYNNTGNRFAIGTGHSEYNASWLDDSDLDSAWGFHNNIMIGPPQDTTCGVTGFTLGVGYSNQMITAPNGPISHYDSAANYFVCTFAASGVIDSLQYRPIGGGVLSIGAAPLPAYITVDYYGTPYSGTIYKGAVQYVSTLCNCSFLYTPPGFKWSN